MIRAVLEASVVFFKRNWLVLILAAILIEGIPELLTNSPISPFPPSGNSRPSQIAPFIIAGLIGGIIILIATTILQSVISRMALNDKQGKEVALFGAFKQVLPALPWVILVNFVAGIAILVGLVFLILPAFVIRFWLFLVVPVATLEERTGISAVFARSKELVKGSFLEIFAIALIVTAPFVIFSAVVDLLRGAPPHFMVPMQTNLGFGIVADLFLAITTAFIYLHLSEIIPQDKSTTANAENLNLHLSSSAQQGESTTPRAENLKDEGFNPFPFD